MSDPVAFEWVDDDRTLGALAGELLDQPAYALDTEFHREKTYFAKVALLQLAWPGRIALVDPLAADIRALAPVLEGPGVAVLHAAQQDLEVLDRGCGAVPSRLFDTQLAAGFLGHSTPALPNLVAAELGVKLTKGDRLTDWLRRPLTPDQCAYAADDVRYLLALRDRLCGRLEAAGRLGWALAECEELRRRPVGPGDPDDAWLRIKDHRHLRGASRGVAQCVAAWRERRAAQLDVPARFVLADLAVLAIAQRPPRTVDELRAVRGIDERMVRSRNGEELLRAIAEGVALPASQLRLPRTDDLERELRPAATLVSAWVSQLAKREKIDTVLLATRADLLAFLNGDASSRLLEGWRARVVGDDLRDLVNGRAALAFSGGQLVLEARMPGLAGEAAAGALAADDLAAHPTIRPS